MSILEKAPSSKTNQTLHVFKQEPNEFVAYEYLQMDKRYFSGRKRESTAVYMPSSSSSAADLRMMGSGGSMSVATVVSAPPHDHRNINFT